MAQYGALDRLKWRLGRKLYMAARGEERDPAMDQNGEVMMQASLLRATKDLDQVIVYDIGANQGDWTESLLKQVSNGADRLDIHAFEPVPQTATMFQARMEKQAGKAPVTLHGFAMSDGAGKAEIGVFGAGAGTNSLHFESDRDRLEQTIEIQLDSLDRFMDSQGHAHVHFIKCDTEGNDARVIAGAKGMLAAGRISVLQFEYNHRWVYSRSFLKDAFDAIADLPYSLVRLGPSQLTVFDAWHPELERYFQSNYALIHDDAAAWFPMFRGNFDPSNVYS